MKYLVAIVSIFIGLIIGVNISKVDGKTAKEWNILYIFESNWNNKQIKIDTCILDAENQFNIIKNLNSSPVEGKEGVIRWDSYKIQQDTENTLNLNKEFCLKRYQ